MEIRIRKGYKCFFVERLNDRNEWIYWLPKDYTGVGYPTPSEALDEARNERDREILDKCKTIDSNGWVETEI